MHAIRLLPRLLALAVVAVLAACGGPSGGRFATGEALSAPGVSCAPFARELSGIAIYGDAGTWWGQARGRYRRSARPEPGAVLVFRTTGRLPEGHVSVVSRVFDPRRIAVTHANWVPGEVDRNQLVVDVSPANDWSRVRVWYPPTGRLGSHRYPTWGFILPPRPASAAELRRAVRPAARYALDNQGRPPPRARGFGG